MNMNLNDVKVEDIARGYDIPYGKVHGMYGGEAIFIAREDMGGKVKVMNIHVNVVNGVIDGITSMTNEKTIPSSSPSFDYYKNTLEGTF